VRWMQLIAFGEVKMKRVVDRFSLVATNKVRTIRESSQPAASGVARGRIVLGVALLPHTSTCRCKRAMLALPAARQTSPYAGAEPALGYA